MALNYLVKENCTRICDGPPNKVLLAALRTGLGTAMHALPAIAQMISEGYDILINCKEFQRPIYDAIGCKTITMREPFGLSWYQEHGTEHGRVVSLATWDQWQQREFGYNTTSTMEAFADILGTTLPDEFSWLRTFNVESIMQKDYILFAPYASERWRSLPPDVADKVEAELQQFGEVIRIEGNECRTWKELCALVAGASVVVAVEGGILNVAGALGKTMVALIGMTEIETTIEQYRKYIPDLQYQTVKGFQPDGCSMPCMRMKDKGFFNDRCLGKHDLPQCMVHLDVPKISEQFSLLVRN